MITYKHKLPNGTVATRRTENEYRFVVLCGASEDLLEVVRWSKTANAAAAGLRQLQRDWPKLYAVGRVEPVNQAGEPVYDWQLTGFFREEAQPIPDGLEIVATTLGQEGVSLLLFRKKDLARNRAHPLDGREPVGQCWLRDSEALDTRGGAA